MKAIAAYVAERLPPRVFAPAIALHAAAAWGASGTVGPGFSPADSWRAFGAALGLMTLLFVQFRLWDDLEDVEHDRVAHPGRVLAGSNRRPFHILLLTLTVAAGGVLARRGLTLAGFVILCTASLAAYRGLRPRISDAVWRYGVLLLKYPSFVLLVAFSLGRPEPARLIAAAIAAYAGASFYEAWHHGRRAGLKVVR